MERQILHIDMNNCYASIEIKLRPELKGLPIVVSASKDQSHGIVLAKSQEAKKFGIVTAEPIWMAKKKCKDLIIVKPHYDEYKKHSIMARKIYYSYTNLVEPFSVDEAWMDITGSTKLFGKPLDIAHEIRERIKKELGITVSVGLSFNKTFAKLGSDLKKPDAVTAIPKDRFKEIVWPLDVGSMIGIGSSTKKKLNDNEIFTLGDLANRDKIDLEKILGSSGPKLWEMANGLEDAPVKDFYAKDPIKSISHGRTYIENIESMDQVKAVLTMLAQKVGQRLIEENLEAMGVQLSVKDKDLKQVSFQETLEYSTFSAIDLRDRALELFNLYKWTKPIRFLEIRAINLTKESNVQTSFLGPNEALQKKSSLDKTLYELQKNFGSDMVQFGTMRDKYKKSDPLDENIDE